MLHLLRQVSFFVLLSVCLSAQAGVLEFTATTFSGVEATSPMTITVRRTGVVTAAATVVVKSADATASAGADYTAVTTTLRWAAGDAADKTVSLALLDDRVGEASETLTLSLSEVTGDTIGSNTQTTVTIADFEQGTLQFSATDYQVAENGGSATITVTRSVGSNGAVTINYATANRTATAPDHYQTKTGTLTFAEGITSQTFAVTVVDNSLGQVDKTIGLTLTTPGGGALAGERLTATLTILNDDVDFTAGLTKITPTRTGVTQAAVINLSQPSPFNSKSSFLQAVNRIPELTITALTAAQSTAGIVTIPVGEATFHLYPYNGTKVSASTTPAIFMNTDSSGRIVTDEGLQFSFQPALAAIDVLQTQLTAMQMPKLTVTEHGNITVQRNQGTPQLDLDSSGKLVINNTFYDRFNVRPAIVSMPATSGSTVGLHMHAHPDAALPKEIYLRIVYSSGNQLRQQLLTSAPAIADELTAGLLTLEGVSNVRFEDFGMIAFTFNGRKHRVYADFMVRRVNPTSYAGQTLRTGMFSLSDVNGDGRDDFRMVYSNGDEQNFIYLIPN
ncbi:MAG: Calx-beta domain-containing protein [Gammaproteobacteria bacterium]|nr:Calx-beta domain-containing protein [Gammaproteobacteria bacterium]